MRSLPARRATSGASLETGRGNTTRTRNARLAAIHSFMRYTAIRDPASLPITTRVLAIPAKRFDRPVLGYLTREQISAILAAPDRSTWSGRRDAVLLTTAYSPTTSLTKLPRFTSGNNVQGGRSQDRQNPSKPSETGCSRGVAAPPSLPGRAGSRSTTALQHVAGRWSA